MNVIVDLALPLVAGICLFAGLTHLLIWLHRRREWVHASFALLSFVVLLYILNQRTIYQATTVDAWNAAHWWTSILVVLFYTAFCWFAVCCSRVRALRSLLGIGALYAGLLIFGILHPAGLFFSSVGDVEMHRLPWGEHVAFAVDAEFSPAYFVLTLSSCLVYTFAFCLCWRQWRAGERVESLLLASSVVLMAASLAVDTLRDVGFVPLYAGEFCFVAFVITMSVSLSRRLRQNTEQQETLNRELQQEITDRKRAAERLRQSQERNRTILSALPDLMFRLSGDGRHLDFYAPTRDQLFVQPEVFLGKTLQEVLPADVAAHYQHHIRETLADGSPQSFEYRLHWPDSGEQCYEARMVPSGRDEVLVIVRNITDRIRANEALKESERFLRSTLDGLSANIALLDERGQILLVNKAWREFASENGLSAEAVSLGTDYLRVCDEASGDFAEEAEAFASGIRRVLSGELPFFALEYPCHSPDRQRWFVGRVTPLPGEGPRCVVVAHEDITERKKTEETIQRLVKVPSHQLGKSFFESMASELAHTLSADYTLIGKLEEKEDESIRTIAVVVDGNLAGNIEYGLADTPCEDVVGKSVCAYASNVAELFPKDTMLRELGVQGYVGVPLFGSDGRALGIVVVLYRSPLANTDFTKSILQIFSTQVSGELERMQAQEALLASEEQFREFVEGTDDLVVQVDKDGRFTYVNHAAEKILGLTPDACIGESAFGFIHPDDRAFAREWFDECTSNRATSAAIEHRQVSRTGEVRNLTWTSNFHYDADGNVDHVNGIARDITTRKRAEVALQQERDRAQRYLDIAGVIIVALDVDGHVSLLNRKGCQVLGVAQKDALGATWFDRFVPKEDRQRTRQVFAELMAGRVDLAEYFENAVLAAPDDERLIAWHNVLLHSEDGAIIGALSSGEDITERRRAEEGLQNALAEIRELKEQIEAENVYLRQEIEMAHLHGDMVVQSDAMKSVLAQAQQVAETDSTVLIQGETGTGKELLARAIHSMSARKDRPLVTVNCAAMPSALVESELFGREKGAYTGALTKQIGRFEVAHGSTVFLDEVGELLPEIQVKLLRVLQEGEIERLGSTKTIFVDVRVLAATNRELQEEVARGNFRQDLFYRLNVFPVTVPPLRERSEDIEPLTWAFVNEFAGTMGKRIDRIASKGMESLKRYHWPGNVRELRNVVERAMIQATGRTLQIRAPKRAPDPVGEQRPLRDVEREHIVKVLERSGWRVRGKGGAAEVLDLKPTTLESMMERLGIRKP